MSNIPDIHTNYIRKPEWLKIRLAKGSDYLKVKDIVHSNHLHTICQSGDCPNMGECWSRGTATFMIMGAICTRACKFCNVATGKPLPLDADEPLRIAESVKLMNLKHCVITSVDRDDLPDLGANFWAQTIRKVKEINPQTTLEVLVPDFQGHKQLVDILTDAKPEIISHNVETVRRLTPQIRTKAQYDVSLQVLKYIAQGGIVAKSGIMLGLGEIYDEVLQTMDDLLAVGCSVITIGQYLQPTRNSYPVQRYATPAEFEQLRQVAIQKGFKHAESAPLVRSSYHAEKHIS